MQKEVKSSLKYKKKTSIKNQNKNNDLDTSLIITQSVNAYI